jgi:hypothetical protein
MNALRASSLSAKFFGYRGAITSAVGATITLGAILIDGEGNGVMAGSFGACTASMYIMQADSALHPTMLSTVSIVEENFVLTPTTEAELYNAAGFNEEDFFIYALRRINNGQTAELIRVESDGTTNVVPSGSCPQAWCSFGGRRAFRTEPGMDQLAAGRLMSGSSLIVAIVSSVM